MSQPPFARAPLFVFAVLTTTSCIDNEAVDAQLGDPHDHQLDDVVAGQNAARVMQGLAAAGQWQPPDTLLASAQSYDFAFDGAPNYDDGTNCSGGPTDGALAFRDVMLDAFAQIESGGIYNCRVIAGTNSMSMHGVGRAIDLMLPTVGGDADNTLGDSIANFLLEHADAIGVQTLIWDHAIWRVSREPQYGAYTGENPHVDHIHVELNAVAADKQTPWFDDPVVPAVCEPLAAGPQELDQGHSCVAFFGPQASWRDEPIGRNGFLRWTNAWQNDVPGNWARFALPVAVAQTYRLEAALNPTFGVYAHTRYRITASGFVHSVEVNQQAPTQAVTDDGFVVLGEFAFSGGNDKVVIEDNTLDEVAANQHIVVDAIRIIPTDNDPLPPPTDTAPTRPDGEVADADDEGTVIHATRAEGCSAGPHHPMWLLLLVLGLSIRHTRYAKHLHGQIRAAKVRACN